MLLWETPVPKVTWSKVNVSLPSDSHVVDGFLTIINKVKERDRGLYLCTAQSVLGVAKAMGLLTVQGEDACDTRTTRGEGMWHYL